MAELPKVGEKAQEFSLSDQSGRKISLADFRGKKNVILYFYPKDDTPGCTREACDFRDQRHIFQKLDTEILGVSVDSVESHKRFTQNHRLSFPLLSDEDKSISTQYGVLHENGYSSRTSFIIDKQGLIRAVFPDVVVEGHWEELWTALENMKAGV